VVGCAGFGSICGSSLATVGTFAKVAAPQMKARGYSPELTAGSVAAGATLASLVPPSITMVIYAAITGTFIVDLFSAALVPALLAVTLQLAAVAVYVRHKPQGLAGVVGPWRERVEAIAMSWPVGALALLILGGIYGGVFTATEAASFGLVLTFFVAAVRRRLTVQTLKAILTDTATTTATIYTIIIGASVFAYFVTASQAPSAFVEMIKTSGMSYGWLLFSLTLMYLALGAIFDETAAMIVTMPFVLPLIIGFGGDPIWWGIVNICIINLGMIIPPVGINVFVLHATLPEYDLKTIYRGVTPFIAADLLRLLILMAVPTLSLWVPHMLKAAR
jgi:C4-dicarboxylate transporter, DctM subunit